MFSSVVYVENNTDYRYYGLSEVFKVDPNKTITVPIEIKLSAFHVETKELSIPLGYFHALSSKKEIYKGRIVI